MNLSFFASKSFLGCLIRGFQIAEYMGAKINPINGFEKDTCIYVKPKTLDLIKDGDWVDIADGHWLPGLLRNRPKVNAIACSQYSYEMLRDYLPNKLVQISQQHLNHENAVRDRQVINTCGYIGALTPTSEKIYKEIGEALEKIGWNFIFCHDYKNRIDAVNFYKKIDLLVVGVYRGDGIYKTPTKMINAASFGIPSIADPLPGYKEFEDYYVRADSLEKMIDEVKKFNNPEYYKNWSNKVINQATKYHISQVAKKYQQLSN